MTKQQTRRAIIEYKVAKPFVDAAALGLGSSAFAVVLQGPALNWALIGSGFSLFWYWGRGNLTQTKRKKKASSVARGGAGSVVVNSAAGSRKVRLGGGFEYAPYEPRHINRETWGETLRWLVMGRPTTCTNATSTPTPKPRWMAEFIFYGQYQGQEIQLLESDVTRFLNAAWRRRKKGVGLSERHWVRKISERPQWYKNVGVTWYYALIDLLWEVEVMSGRQLIIPTGWQQNALARDPHQTLEALRWAQAQKGNVQPIAPDIPRTNELAIGTEGVSSFDG